jgi:6-phosphogluconolactonase
MKPEIVIVPDFAGVTRRTAELFTEAAERSIASKGRFSAALSGAATPQAFHRLLSEPPFRGRIDWTKTHLFFGDERAVPADDPECNYRMARESLISRVPIPPGNVHRMPADRPDLAAAASEYEAEIRSVIGGTVPVFDLIHLGIGEDGHTASLFPGGPALAESKRLVVESYAESLKSWRMTFTLPLINRADCVLFMADGRRKTDAVRRALTEDGDPVPARFVRPESGKLIWILDKEASAGLEKR